MGSNKPTCLCGTCRTCRKRVWNRAYEARVKAKREQERKPVPPLKPRGQRREPLPSHNRALRFNAKKRPYDPVEAAEHFYAVFIECPAKDKPHLLSRIEMLVRDMTPLWGGFRFDEIPH